ncbi:iron chaperone [Amphibacillus sp. MSJ-3]|uniref:iron chaperone n=1 Tax=Amphibacillus sp. MSJ-3 TaxID=2841505 RepID=UPI001C0EB64E|nr:iron chaperone [Amphibacillus sp. MSJ-3]
MDNFTEFLTAIDHPDHRERTREVLKWVRETFPKLDAQIKWNQPMFIDHGTYIIGFSVAKQHLAVAPELVTINQFTEKIKQAGYSQTKQLFRIKWNQAVDYELLKEIIQFNIDDKVDDTSFWRK